ncbi:MAG TPA: methyltransferase domain-containing protein [Thermoplasmata archaeon]|nr:methyltransferase domain-containing protein [Thermoplasmata archaeon]
MASPTRQVAAEFDEISAVYDETRDPLAPKTLDALAAEFGRDGVRSLLEVGVGTGRIASPLAARGLAITGIDASRGMLARARAKGLGDLVRGSGYRLPFADETFDAALFVHVLHVLERPEEALREASRVTRFGVFALVHPRGAGWGSLDRTDGGARGALRGALEELGYPLPPRDTNPWSKERTLLTSVPPDDVRTIAETDVTISLRQRLDRLARRGQRHLLKVPPETLRRAIELARARVGDRTVTVHRVESLAIWSPGRWATAASPA